MSQVIALIPARSGSKGIPGKNHLCLGNKTLVEHAYNCAVAAGLDGAVITTDYDVMPWSKPQDEVDEDVRQRNGGSFHLWMPLRRPDTLAQDDTPMFDVVQHAVNELKLADDDLIVLLQPTQPFRTPAHIQEAIRLLRMTQADSVVSVVELPRTHSPEMAFEFYPGSGRLVPWRWWCECGSEDFANLPRYRQEAKPAYIRDGTCYAFWVKTLKHGNLYGQDVRPLIIPPEQSCELDTEADWADVERRWRERHG
jgi:CMP-N,N'-diacetyllegionaminic acid synthase